MLSSCTMAACLCFGSGSAKNYPWGPGSGFEFRSRVLKFLHTFIFFPCFFIKKIKAWNLPLYHEKRGKCRNFVFKTPKLGYRKGWFRILISLAVWNRIRKKQMRIRNTAVCEPFFSSKQDFVEPNVQCSELQKKCGHWTQVSAPSPWFCNQTLSIT